MYRTTLMLALDLKNKAMQLAQREHISMGELIREASIEKIDRKMNESHNLFFADNEFYQQQTPTDLSVNHDHYLYD